MYISNLITSIHSHLSHRSVPMLLGCVLFCMALGSCNESENMANDAAKATIDSVAQSKITLKADSLQRVADSTLKSEALTRAQEQEAKAALEQSKRKNLSDRISPPEPMGVQIIPPSLPRPPKAPKRTTFDTVLKGAKDSVQP